MPIDPDFYKKLLRKAEQHSNQASGDKHYVWGERLACKIREMKTKLVKL